MTGDYQEQYLSNMLEEILKIRNRNTERLFGEINSYILDSLMILAQKNEITDGEFRKCFIELMKNINDTVYENIFTINTREDVKQKNILLSEVIKKEVDNKKTFGYLLSDLSSMNMKDIRLLIACVSNMKPDQVFSIVSIEDYTGMFNLNENRYMEFKEASESIKNFEVRVVFQNKAMPIKFDFFDVFVYVDVPGMIMNDRFVEYKIVEGMDVILSMILELFNDAVSTAHKYGYGLTKVQLGFFKRIYLGRR